jgi:drug/metabolite transporter (DMT)-like permease
LADWFFLWGYVKALIYVSVLQYTVINTSFGPVVSALMGLLVLGEQISRYKMCGLLRNVALAFLITDPFGERSSVTILVTGFLWVIVAAAGTGAMRIVQRSNAAIPPIVFMFWGYVLNTLLWLPPGCIPPKIRVSFLWPSVPQDSTDLFGLPMSTWIVMLLSGVLGASIMLAQGQALKYLDVGTYSMLVTPLALVQTVIYSSISASLGRLVWLGVSLQALAIMVDMYQETRSPA